MDLISTLRSTGAVRTFTDETVPDAVLASILDVARFAPSGGNRQAWRVIIVRDESKRRELRNIYLDAWFEYVGHIMAGLVAFSPLATDEDRASAHALRAAAEAASNPEGFAENLHTVPALMVICADLRNLAATDRDLDRYQFIGGASIYPFIWNILLAAREWNLGGVMTTVATRNEADVRSLFDIPPEFAVASVLALGHPVNRLTKLSRRPVPEFTTVDSFGGPYFESELLD